MLTTLSTRSRRLGRIWLVSRKSRCGGASSRGVVANPERCDHPVRAVDRKNAAPRAAKLALKLARLGWTCFAAVINGVGSPTAHECAHR